MFPKGLLNHAVVKLPGIASEMPDVLVLRLGTLRFLPFALVQTGCYIGSHPEAVPSNSRCGECPA
eukprot:1973977-Amphidinium_carterae.1